MWGQGWGKRSGVDRGEVVEKGRSDIEYQGGGKAHWGVSC